MMPVLHYATKYYNPALYDDELTIKTTIKELPTARIHFDFEVFNQEGEKLNDAEATLVFVNMKTKKPCHAPENLMSQLKKHF